ncbi:putative ZIP Zinc transporter [Lyophyllum shimeji]|uniref:ZIP Zinc transporter n=1 Tax=Lyophyllum shimeji TaxID=47721 RepID=A0A9P3PWP9_LYOSH|nr:putative ZIP Zinc transporter [Lyophyllum shimeji]
MPALTARGLALLSEANASPDKIGTMVGIFCISLFAVSFPGVSKQIPFLRIPQLLFFTGKHFGTGAILATAFCHLLPDAFDALKDKEVDRRYDDIGRWVGAIILASLLLIFLVEFISTSYVDHLQANSSVAPSRATSPAPSRPKTPPRDIIPPAPRASLPDNNTDPLARLQCPSCLRHVNHCSSPTCAFAASESTPLLKAPKRAKSFSNFDPHRDEALLPLILFNSPRLSRPHAGLIWGREIPCLCQLERARAQGGGEEDNSEYGEGDADGPEEEQVKPKIGRRRQIVGILVLQLGIMIHSLVIGLTLAVTSGGDFRSLVTAIIFHQLFEGLSLGIRIAALPPPHHPPTSSQSTPAPSRSRSRSPTPIPQTPRSTSSHSSSSSSSRSHQSQSESQHHRRHPHHRHHGPPSWSERWLAPTLAMLFAVTTPAGMVLGVLLFTPHKAVSSPRESARMHLTQGLMSAISAGMLVYASTVEMLAGDFVFGDVTGGEDAHGHGHGQGHHDPGHGEEHEHEQGEERRLGPNGMKALAVASLLAGATAMTLVGVGE